AGGDEGPGDARLAADDGCWTRIERRTRMRPRLRWTALAGLAGGAAFSVALFLTFGLLGGARVGQTGLLFNPAFQSHKVIAVWKEIQPLPWLVSAPARMLRWGRVAALG